MKKKDRLDAILKLIEEEEIDKQEELTERLNAKGFKVSQATVSRDINELSLIKVEGLTKKFKYAVYRKFQPDKTSKTISLFKQVCLSIVSANNLIVIKTLSGNAGTAGMAIDHMQIPEILGTVAGDDTLLIITKTNFDAEALVKLLRNF